MRDVAQQVGGHMEKQFKTEAGQKCTSGESECGRPPCAGVLPNEEERNKEVVNRNYKTPRGEHRQNTLWHKSQQDPL